MKPPPPDFETIVARLRLAHLTAMREQALRAQKIQEAFRETMADLAASVQVFVAAADPEAHHRPWEGRRSRWHPAAVQRSGCAGYQAPRFRRAPRGW